MPWIRTHSFGGRLAAIARIAIVFALVACGGDSTGPNDDDDRVATVTITPGTPPSLVPQQTTQLTATLRNAAGESLPPRPVTWSASPSGIVTVTADGLSATITAVAAGTATITATSEGKSGTATITVNEGGYLGPAGGQITAAGGALRIQVPAGALGASTAITVSPVASPPAAAGLIQGTAYDLGPNGLGFSQPVTVTIRYEASSVGQDMDPSSFRVHRWNGSAWEPLGNGTVNAATREVSGTTSSFSIFAVIGELGSPAPSITAISPASAFAGSDGFTLTVTGADFIEGSVIRWNGSDRPTTFVSATELRAEIPATDLAEPGEARVTVFTPAPGGGTSDALAFTILPAPGSVAARLALGLNFTCGLDASGAAYCWGLNDQGQLGNGQAANSAVPSPVLGGLTFMQLATGHDHACAITASGAAYCWGGNFQGQHGVGHRDPSKVPVPVSGGLTFRAIGAGNWFTCGLTTEGAAYCWGANNAGQLGTGGGGAGGANDPRLVAGGHVFVKLAVGSAHACALTEDGTAYCWGSNSGGRLGDGTTSNRNAPVPVSGGHTFVDITAGASHSCALERDGTAYCWGTNDRGQLGDGTNTNRLTPVPVIGEHTWIALRAGGNSTCGVTLAGEARCWGDGSSGQLAISVLDDPWRPSPVQTGETFRYVIPGFSHTCGVTTGDAAFCWGARGYGALGTGDAAYVDAPVPVVGGHVFTRVEANTIHTCGVTTENVALCWGSNNDGQLGAGLEMARSLAPVTVVGDHEFTTVVTGGDHTCGLDVDGFAWCWGYNGNGQLGDGTTESASAPVQVAGGTTFVALSAGWGHTCGLTAGGQVYCWGRNSEWQLGIGSQTHQYEPVLVSFGGPLVIAQISAGFRHTCARASTGAVYCWGYNDSNQTGNQGVVSTPRLVPGNHNFAWVSAGWYHTCGVLTNGSVRCWGSNSDGRLGTGSSESRVTTPEQVIGLSNITQVTAGETHTCAIASDGQAYCWGNGYEGQLGRGTTYTGISPMPVAGGHQFAQLDAGSKYTCGVTTAGVAYCWGWQDSGELGIDTPSFDPPVPVAGGIVFDD